ncbi:MAG: hypothetical protein JSW52_01985 [Candidatus Coatesbacteria bacterium]|nr:MAG: hypothetical protein JSW52_01985 [Candidatus Coatesbacteria bacterium]
MDAKRLFPLSLLLAVVLIPLVDCGDGTVSVSEEIVVGIYADDGASPGCVGPAEKMFEWMGCTIVFLYAGDVNGKPLDKIDILYFPGGDAGPYVKNISAAGKEKIRDFVRGGGGYIGTCAGGCFASETIIWLGNKYTGGNLGLFRGVADGPINEIYPYPKHGMCEINYTAPKHPITRGLGDTEWIYYWWGPKFIPYRGANVNVIGTYAITGDPAMVAFEYGDGRVFLIGPHPEWEEDSDRDGYPPSEEHDDRGSDWPLMRNVTFWCAKRMN